MRFDGTLLQRVSLSVSLGARTMWSVPRTGVTDPEAVGEASAPVNCSSFNRSAILIRQMGALGWWPHELSTSLPMELVRMRERSRQQHRASQTSLDLSTA